MRLPTGSYRAPMSLVFCMATLFLAGCQPVQEDRSITWSGDGKEVGFQHGKEGVFVADRDGQGLEKVFEPGPEVLATSTPLWSPTDRRLIFTTARDAQRGVVHVVPPAAEPDPEGDLQFPRSVIYTCWLKEEAADAEPRALFEASCDHLGYVSANLAVRWHPQATSIVFIDQVAEGHALFEYDLATKSKRRILPQAADAIVFDWTLDGSHLVCGLGQHASDVRNDGLWIGRPGETSWWHVPESTSLAPARLDSLLERLRASRPAWSNDGHSFAFVAAAAQQAAPGSVRIWRGDLATREVELLVESDEPLRDLVWAPDGESLGVIRQADPATLHLLTLDGVLSSPIGERPVRKFAGWDPAGNSLAYVAAADIPFSSDDNWALLLMADSAARDAVFVAPADGRAAPREVVSGMRVTFPRWSPTETKLSLWFTFSPSHRSWLSRWLGWGLRRGDPAAVLDMATGDIGWLAVSPFEKTQIGHYHLLKRGYAEAWSWYEQAVRETPMPAKTENVADYLRAWRCPVDFSLFEYVCLRKLGRTDEAAEKLEQFRGSFPPELPNLGLGGVTNDGQSLKERVRELLSPEGLAVALLRDLYASEVFLSVDAVDVGEDFFRERIAAGANEPQRLSAAIVLAQLLLLQDKRDQYLDLAVDEFVRPVFAARPPRNITPDWDWFSSHGVLLLTGGLTLLPIASPEFLEGVDDMRVARLAETCEALRAEAANGEAWWLDFALVAIHGRLGRAESQGQDLARLGADFGALTPANDDAMNRLKKELREMVRQLTK
ncbi:MAG TPA: hypothetical protein VGX78_07200 [Pirellulales bacterium]|nr:hypothetical protein [Pirellulales bacterium]